MQTAAEGGSKTIWADTETGNIVDIDPNPSGQYLLRSVLNEGTTDTQLVDAVTGRVASADESALYQDQQAKAFDASLPDLSSLPPDRQWYYTERMPVGMVKRMAELGKFSPDFAASIGPWIASKQAEADDRSGFDSHIMDSINTERIHFENQLESWKESPERLALGINTPLETELWGSILGKEYDPNVNMYGGPTKADYQQSAEEGNDPSLSSASHNATEGIIGGWAGAYAGGTEYGQSPYGKPTIAATRGAAGSLNSGGDAGDALTAGITAGAGSTALGTLQGGISAGGGEEDMWDYLDEDYYEGGFDDSFGDYGDDYSKYFDSGADETGAFDQFGWQSEPGNPDSGSILDGFNGGGGLSLSPLLNMLGRLGGGAASALGGAGTVGRGMLNSILSDPMGSAFNMTPFLLAMAEANNQKNDVRDITNRLNDLEGEASTANVQSMVLNPYDRQTALGRSELLSSLTNRGVMGSSFGNQDLTAFDTTRSLGRGDLATKALMGSIGTRGALLDQILQGTNKMHTNKNMLLGAGLNASGNLFRPERKPDPFGLQALLGG